LGKVDNTERYLGCGGLEETYSCIFSSLMIKIY
jgi:hypothetical protein